MRRQGHVTDERHRDDDRSRARPGWHGRGPGPPRRSGYFKIQGTRPQTAELRPRRTRPPVSSRGSSRSSRNGRTPPRNCPTMPCRGTACLRMWRCTGSPVRQASSANLYYESRHARSSAGPVAAFPTGVAVFAEADLAIRRYGERLVQCHPLERFRHRRPFRRDGDTAVARRRHPGVLRDGHLSAISARKPSAAASVSAPKSLMTLRVGRGIRRICQCPRGWPAERCASIPPAVDDPQIELIGVRKGIRRRAPQGGRRRGRRPDRRRRRALRDPRPVRIGQDHGAAHDRRIRAADGRAPSASAASTSPHCLRAVATSTPSFRNTHCSPT